jgi:hypothetical protein
MSLEQLPLDWSVAVPRAEGPEDRRAELQRACWECLRALLTGSATAAELRQPHVGKLRYSARLCQLRPFLREQCGLSPYDVAANPILGDGDSRNPTFRLAPWARHAAEGALTRWDAVRAEKRRGARPGAEAA